MPDSGNGLSTILFGLNRWESFGFMLVSETSLLANYRLEMF